MRDIKIAPSLLSSDFSNLEREIKNCEKFGADVIHLDIMDGHFVPNITFGPPVVSAIRKHTDLPFDCHLMISEPDKYIPHFAEAGADWLSIHTEATNHLHRSLSLIKSFGKKAGIAINPVTPLEFVFEAAEYSDFIMLMSVNPGFGGQSFIESFFRRSEKLRNFLDKEGLNHIGIEVDGGIKISNARDAIQSGANILVSGSGLFKGNLKDNIAEMKSAVLQKE
jgi:ribulose-phosphate 3-epimerase